MRNQPDVVPSPHVLGLLLAPDHSSARHPRALHVAEDNLRQCAGPRASCEVLKAAGALSEGWTAPACADCPRQQLELVVQMPAGLILDGMLLVRRGARLQCETSRTYAEVMPEFPSTTELIPTKLSALCWPKLTVVTVIWQRGYLCDCQRSASTDPPDQKGQGAVIVF